MLEEYLMQQIISAGAQGISLGKKYMKQTCFFQNMAW